MEKIALSVNEYLNIVKQQIPISWRTVASIHNVKEQMINAIAEYCYNYQLSDRDLYSHLHENELICAADWEHEPQGTDWWMNLSTEANMLENQGCISTFND